MQKRFFKVAITYDGYEDEEEDEVFDSEDAANEYGAYLVSCYHTGAEILNMSNPGDYPSPEEDEKDVDYVVHEYEEDDD